MNKKRTYHVDLHEVEAVTYRVEATSEEEALELVKADATLYEQTGERAYVGITGEAEAYRVNENGMPVAEGDEA
jgi:hypothetical protein